MYVSLERHVLLLIYVYRVCVHTCDIRLNQREKVLAESGIKLDGEIGLFGHEKSPSLRDRPSPDTKRVTSLRKRALCFRERALLLRKRAPSLCKRALCLRKRAKSLFKRALSLRKRALSLPNAVKRCKSFSNG